MARRGRAWRIGLALGMLVSAPLAAQPRVGSARLSWVRGAGAERCPDAGAIEARVTESLGRDVFARPPAQSIEVTVTREGPAWTATVRAYDPDGAPRGTRTLTARGDDCAPLSELATVAVALSIDPEARAPAAPPPQPPPAPPPPPPPPPAPLVARPTVVGVAEPPRPRRAFQVGGFVTAGVLPGASAGLSLAVDAWAFGRLRAELDAMWWPQSSAAGGYPARFGLTALGARGCVALTRGARWTPSLCAEAHVGALYAAVYERTPVDPGVAPWVSAGVGARLRWRPAGLWVIELDAALWANLLRYNFTVQGAGASVFDQPVCAAVGRAGVGLEW